ncbi:MAG: lipopolysaccharide transport periplasmic protein LptA [Rhizomicrobium sp.]
MISFRWVMLATLSIVAIGAGAHAQGLNLGSHASHAPIAVSADRFSGDLNTKAGAYQGNVIVSQGNFKLHADRVDVKTQKGAINDIIATGHVLFDAPNGQAQGQKGIYQVNLRTITLSGNVVLTRQKNVMRGTQLVINLENGLAQLTAQGTPGGRVQGLFVPPARQTPQKKPVGKAK